MAQSMDRQSPQMEASFHLLQRVWVMPLPTGSEEETSGAEETTFGQVLVLALRWPGARFGAAPSQAVLAVPAEAVSEYVDVVSVPLYLPESESSAMDGQVAILVVPDSVPVGVPCTFFSDEPHDALPRGFELAALFDFPEEFSTGLVVRLVGEASGELMLSVHRHGVRQDGSGEEAYHSTTEMPADYDPRRVMQPAKRKAKPAALPALLGPEAHGREVASRVRGLGATPKKQAGGSASGPAPVSSADAQTEALTALTDAVMTLSDRMSKLEAANSRPTTHSAPQHVPGPSAAAQGSLLSAGRLGAEPGQSATQKARSILQSLPGPPEGDQLPRAGKPGRQRQHRAIAEGAQDSQSAIQLATLEALDRIMKRQSAEDPLEDLGEDDEFEVALAKVAGGAKGASAMMKVNRAIEQNPQRWSQMCDNSMARALGVHVTGLPRSASLYAQQRIRFGNKLDLERMFHMLAALHSAHRAGEHALVGARISQYMKAVEQATHQGGNWRLAGAVSVRSISKRQQSSGRADQTRGCWRGSASISGGAGELSDAYEAKEGFGEGQGRHLGPQSDAERRQVRSPWEEVKQRLEQELLKVHVPRQGQSWKKLGVAQPRTMLLGAYTGQGAGISRLSVRHAVLIGIVHEAARWRCVQHPYSSLMVSMQLSAHPHRDMRNEGPNSLLVLGNYEGGQLLVEDKSGDLSFEVHGQTLRALDVSCHGEWVQLVSGFVHVSWLVPSRIR
eukprot:4408304-Amphidinium_carterae.2